MLKKYYDFGEYYSPRDIFYITKKKLKRTKWSALLFPITFGLFLFNIFLSTTLYHIFILNKFFFKVNFRCSEDAKLSAKIFVRLMGFIYEIYYILYRITMPIHKFCVKVYKKFPSKVEYYSNQSPFWYNKDIKETKANYRIEFDNIINTVAEITKIVHPKQELDELFEEDFFWLIKQTVPEIYNAD